MDLTIAINCRRDPALTWTLDNIKRATKGDHPEVIVVYDGNQQRPDLSAYEFVRVVQTGRSAMGTSFARHTGVINATHERVITCDSHIDFYDGAIQKMGDALAAMPNAVICTKCRMLTGKVKKKADNTYYGADLIERVDGEDVTAVQVRGECERVAIAGKWRTSTDVDCQIGCIMGGCYGLTKSAYMDSGEPWKYGKGWGCDEESISIAYRSTGKAVMIINATIGHVYQATTTYPQKPIDSMNVWYNRYRVAAMAAKDEAQLAEYIKFMRGGMADIFHNQVCMAVDDINEWREYISKRGEVMVVVPVERKPHVARKLVEDVGVPCVHCRERFGHKVNNVYPNGNRGMKCGSCSGTFISFRKRG
jgi:glycosyltransferase involved in cell wall biosynthesis